MHKCCWIAWTLLVLGASGCYRVSEHNELFDSEDIVDGDLGSDTNGDSTLDTSSDVQTDLNAETDIDTEVNTDTATGIDTETHIDTEINTDTATGIDTEINIDTETHIDTETGTDIVDSFIDIRPLKEINTTGADAYPYLSPDGLRLYFSQGSNSSTSFYAASRESLTEPFGNKRLISADFGDNARGCWLTDNELEIYFLSDNELHYASRETVDGVFSDPVQVELLGDFSGFVNGPSLTPDKQELYLFHHEYIFVFEQTGPLSYTFREKVVFPSEYLPRPGQLSKDGLHYYVPLVDTENDRSHLYRFSRDSVLEAFDALTKVIIEDEQPLLYYSQPSVSADRNIVVFVGSSANLWEETDLYIGVRSGK